MPYDVPLILSLVVFFFSIFGFMSAIMEKEPPVRHAITLGVACALFAYAWYVSHGELGMNSVPDAFLRIVAKFS